MSILPLISYPTAIAIVDDDSLLLDALGQLFKNEYPLVKFNDPNNCADFFKNYVPLSSKLKWTRGCTESENYDIANHLPIDIDFSILKELRIKEDRANEISVIIVDYHMPGMNGIDLCRQLKSLPVKKILLTGEADEKIAIAAFNEGYIDCFIKKGSPSITKELRSHLRTLTEQYLSERTAQLFKHLETDYALPISDPQFVTLFKDWCRKNDILEYFIVDKNANFLLIDKNKKHSFFVTHTERTLKNLIELYEDNKEATPFLEVIQSGEKVPYFGEDRESWEVDIKEWEKHFYTPEVLQGREKYYWAVV